MGWRGVMEGLAVAGIVIAVPVPPERVSRPIGEVSLPPNRPSPPAVGEAPGRSGARPGGPVWAVPKTPDQASRPIREVALPPRPPAEWVADDIMVPGRSGSGPSGGPIWATPRSPDQVSRPIGEVSKAPDEVSRPIGEVSLPARLTPPAVE